MHALQQHRKTVENEIVARDGAGRGGRRETVGAKSKALLSEWLSKM